MHENTDSFNNDFVKLKYEHASKFRHVDIISVYLHDTINV